jgi:hypothetical protein
MEQNEIKSSAAPRIFGVVGFTHTNSVGVGWLDCLVFGALSACWM